MSKRDSKSGPGGYEVGYAKPPAKHQFKSGQSGNPNGRPRKNRAQQDDVGAQWGISTLAAGRVLYEEVAVTQNGKTRKMPMIEAVHRRRAADALKGGNRLLQREVIAEANAEEQRILRAEIELYLEYKRKKAEGQQAIEQARKAGKPEPILLPHPDDIIIDDENMAYEVVGPNCKASFALSQWGLQLRDHLVLRYVYTMRFPSLLYPVDPEGHESFAAVAKALNDGLCLRLRWGQNGFWKATQAHQKKGFRLIERDMLVSLEALANTWRNDPGLESLRRQKTQARIVEKLLKFKTRGHERRLGQMHYDRTLSVLSAIFGPEAVAHIPKRLALRPYAEREADEKRLIDAAEPDTVKRIQWIEEKLARMLR